MMGDDGNSLRVPAYTFNYDTRNLLSQDGPAPDLRDEGTPRHATSGTRIEFIWLHQNMPKIFLIRTIALGAKRRDKITIVIVFKISKMDCDTDT